jgi:hypothetical protein
MNFFQFHQKIDGINNKLKANINAPPNSYGNT